MLVRFFVVAVLCCIGQLAGAEVIQLKEKASVAGKILAEKKDLIVIDVGYTVLTIPRTHIARIVKDEAAPPKSKSDKKSAVSAPSEAAKELYATARAGQADKSVRELVNELGEAVVQVRTPGGLGSGFILTEDGYLITNFHVIEGETQISIEVYHQRNGQLERKTYKDVKIVAMNKFHDLALLKIDDKDASKFATVPLGDSDSLAVGESVFAIGSPLGLERTVTEGIVSTKTRQWQGELYLQTTAQINPGNSGGPLFNLRGEVLGVTNMKIAFGEGIGFAIPVESVRYFLKHRDAYAYDSTNPSNAYHYLAPPSRLAGSKEAIEAQQEEK